MFQVKTTSNEFTSLTAWLSLHIRPRYFVSGLEGTFYERPPYRSNPVTDDPTPTVATRFLGLARVGNPSKEKWLFALSLTPIEKMAISELTQRTTDETQCPFFLQELEQKGEILSQLRLKICFIVFKIGRKKQTTSQSSQFFYDMHDYEEEKRWGKKQKRQKIEFDQSKCWFCLASPSVEKHLVITVGTRVYVALAKGRGMW